MGTQSSDAGDAPSAGSRFGLLDRWLPSGTRFDGAFVALSLVLVGGIALDVRAHGRRDISFAEEGFLTPEHVLFYSAFLLLAALLLGRTAANRRRGATWLAAVPAGYGAGVLGVVIFALGGAGDYLWHSAFGFEQGLEIAVSPTHLSLIAGAALFLSSPARAASRREGSLSVPAGIAVSLSVGLALSVVVLIAVYVNPVVRIFPARPGSTAVARGLASLIVFPTMLLGVTLALVRRFDLPVGGLTLALFLPGLASAQVFGDYVYVLPVLVAGLVADGLAVVARPSVRRPLALRAFGALVPASFAASYVLLVAVQGRLAWTVHVWTGAVVVAGAAGLLATYMVVPDGGAVPDEGWSSG